MKYQPLNDLIDPEVPAADAPKPEPEADPDAREDAYVIGARGNTLQAPSADLAKEKAKKDDEHPRRWMMPAAVLTAILCAGLTIWNISRFTSGPPAPPPATDFQARQQLYLGVMKVEAYRRGHGVTPDTMQDAGLTSPPYSYARLGSTKYTLGVQVDGRHIEFNSSIPLNAYFGPAQQMLKTAGQGGQE